MGAPMYCTTCGHAGPTRRVMPGSFLIEVVLWLCFLVPGLLYSLWRHSATKPGCESCASTALIPTNAPILVGNAAAQQEIRNIHVETSGERWVKFILVCTVLLGILFLMDHACGQ